VLTISLCGAQNCVFAEITINSAGISKNRHGQAFLFDFAGKLCQFRPKITEKM